MQAAEVKPPGLSDPRHYAEARQVPAHGSYEEPTMFNPEYRGTTTLLATNGPTPYAFPTDKNRRVVSPDLPTTTRQRLQQQQQQQQRPGPASAILVDDGSIDVFVVPLSGPRCRSQTSSQGVGVNSHGVQQQLRGMSNAGPPPQQRPPHPRAQTLGGKPVVNYETPWPEEEFYEHLWPANASKPP